MCLLVPGDKGVVRFDNGDDVDVDAGTLLAIWDFNVCTPTCAHLDKLSLVVCSLKEAAQSRDGVPALALLWSSSGDAPCCTPTSAQYNLLCNPCTLHKLP